ncbi:hypothetical protein RHMOL_Rhmol04G0296900 [Rhododendron molle]|uniref:Uncharacterized protein n=1 Tax=Rhododendron molle TaxID=49168 RepID=A0ACC0P5L1_RHOML|nr:hypothetical protein RHMOL_Rhmol04G0296900 [Rhododendron molle]
MGSRSRGDGNYRNPCLTMHQPWASLLVYGIKRIEGRSWPSPIRGCVEVVGCVTLDELVSWEELPEGRAKQIIAGFASNRRLEDLLYSTMQKLIVPFEMRGYQGVYNLEKKIYEAAVRGLSPVTSPLPVKFPLPDPRDRFSLKPGSLASDSKNSKAIKMEKPPSLDAAIAGARAAATQFSNKDSSPSVIQDGDAPISARTRNKRKEAVEGQDSQSVGVSDAKDFRDQCSAD